jgi:hypothetical protein
MRQLCVQQLQYYLETLIMDHTETQRLRSKGDLESPALLMRCSCGKGQRLGMAWRP